jgi:lipopolysaccharide exporter
MRVRGVMQNSAFALAGDLAAKGGMLVVMMVAARGLSTREFAAFATAIAVATVMTAALDAGSQTLLTRDGVAGPAVRGPLLRALAAARAPMLLLCLTAAVIAGVMLHRPLDAVATVLLATAGAIQLSLTGALRSAQDLRPEAMAKLATGLLEVAAAGVCLLLFPRAGVMLIALALATLVAQLPLLGAARHAIAAGTAERPLAALRRAAPLGAMALATLAYYRSGTIALSVASTPSQTARFATASTLAWGMLCVGNAVTTGLLPRLSAAATAAERADITRRTIWWLTGFSAGLGAAVALLARPLLTVVFGHRYGAAAGPLALLAAATVLIAPAGVIGTALISERRLRPVGVQVAASLVTNVLALALLVPALGAAGAALATIACEVVGLALLGHAYLAPVASTLALERPLAKAAQ